MVGIIKYFVCFFKSCFKVITLTYKLSYKLGDSNYRVCVVKLYGKVLFKLVKAAKACLMLVYSIGNRGSGKEIFLSEAELFTFVCVIVGVKDT